MTPAGDEKIDRAMREAMEICDKIVEESNRQLELLKAAMATGDKAIKEAYWKQAQDWVAK